MTTQSIILPYARISPLYIPRRDLVLSAADSLSLHVTVVESDDPSAMALELTGGIGGPSLRLLIWGDNSSGGGRCDYSRPWSSVGELLFSAVGTISDSAIGTFDVSLPAGTLGGFPRRCLWAMQLDYDNATFSEMLAHGVLNIVHSFPGQIQHTALETDDSIVIDMDDLSAHVEV